MSSSVSEWLNAVPWLARAIDSTRYELAIVRNKPEQDVILHHLVSRLQSNVQYHAGEASLDPPPYELVGALFLDGERRIMRKDAWGLFMDNFNRPERFFLQVCRPDTENERVRPNLENIQGNTLASAVALELAFKSPYEGNAKSRFLTALETYEHMYDPQIHHGRVIPILQSSACGKSRLVKELSTEEYVVSICLRNDRNPASGWPPGDVGVSRFFGAYGGEKYKGEEISAAFLGALAQVLADSIIAPSSSESHEPRPDPLASWKYTLHIPNTSSSPLSMNPDRNPPDRENHIAKIIFRAQKTLLDNRGWLEKERAWVDRVRYIQERSGVLGGAEAEARKWHSTLFARFCLSGFQALDRKLRVLSGTQREDHCQSHRRFFIALDGCTALGESNPYEPNGQMHMLPEDEMSLGAMWRILKAADVLHTGAKNETVFWFLLLDTDPGPFLRLPGSTGRKEKVKMRALPPFVYLGFNQMAAKGLGTRKGIKYPCEALQLKHLKMYGRPYWSTLPTASLLSHASSKLFWSATSTRTGFDPYKQTHVFAAFAARLPLPLQLDLSIDNGREKQNAYEAARELEREMVRNHMRMIISVSPSVVVEGEGEMDWEMKTSAPSEPALALAATWQLTQDTDRRKYRIALGVLSRELALPSLIDISSGRHEELYVGLLCILARDGIHSGAGEEFFLDRKRTAVRSFTLGEWLGSLLGAGYGYGCDSEKTDFNSQEKDRELAIEHELCTFSSKATMTWTHIHALTRPFDEFPIELVRWAFFTGAGLQQPSDSSRSYSHNMKGRGRPHGDVELADLLFPAYVGDMDEPWDDACLVLVGVMVRGGEEGLRGVSVSPIVYPSEELEGGLPIRREQKTVMIVMDFSATTSLGVELTRRRVSTALYNRNPQPQVTVTSAQIDGPRDSEETEDFVVKVRGRGESVYPILGGGFEGVFEGLLGGGCECGLDGDGVQEFKGMEEEVEREMDRFEFVGEGKS